MIDETKSCVVSGKNKVSVIQQEINYQGIGTLVRITRGGICGSDLHYYHEGKVGTYQVKQPMILGHEVIGVVVESDSDKIIKNQKVAINPSKPCGHCEYCKSHEENQCVNMRFFGSAMYFPHVDGGFTQYKIVDTSQCIPFDDQASEQVMAFAEPLAVAIHAVNQSGDIKGKKVFISGVGPIGCLVVAAAKAMGAKEIVCTDVSARSLTMASAMGATTVLNAVSADFSSYLKDKGYFDVSFEVSGHPQSISRCLAVTRAKGTMVQVGMGGAVPDFPIMMLIAKEITLTGTFRFKEEFNTSVEWLNNNTINPLPLLSAEFCYDELEKALLFASDKTKAAKVQLTF